MFLGEAVTWASAIGCGLVLFAVVLIFEKIPGFARPVAPVPVPVLAKPCGNAS